MVKAKSVISQSLKLTIDIFSLEQYPGNKDGPYFSERDETLFTELYWDIRKIRNKIKDYKGKPLS